MAAISTKTREIIKGYLEGFIQGISALREMTSD